MSQHLEDYVIAKTLGCSPEEIAAERERWQNNHILRAVFEHEFAAQIQTLRNTLETVKPEELKDTQGQIKGLKLAKGLILKSKS